MTNHEIADIFESLSKLMDIHGMDSFRSKSYATAAFRIEKLPMALEKLSLDELVTVPNIGKSLAEKIHELNTTGSLKQLEDILAKTPSGVVEMLRIKGLGPKKVAVLWKDLGLESIGELEYACNENRLLGIKGFGQKIQQGILENIAFLKSNAGFWLFAETTELVNAVQQEIFALYPKALCSTCDNFRKQELVISQIDFVTTLKGDEIIAALKQFNFDDKNNEDGKLVITLEALPALHFTMVDSDHEYYKQLFERSCSPAFLDAFNASYEMPQNIQSEAQIFVHNKMDIIPAPYREEVAVLEKAKNHQLPKLIATEDIKGVIHCHSTYSDGRHTLEEMAKSARDKGFEYLVISDHSQTAAYAGGLFPDAIRKQHIEIDQLNQQLAPFKIFKSIESDILGDGRLDYSDDLLQTFDLVIASVHSNLSMTEEKAMQRLITAVEHPATRILGHPTGRLLLSRLGYPVDHKKLIDACVANNVVIEINANPRRLDLDWTWISYALDKGALLSINPDAHSTEGIDVIKYGVYAAQKGGLSKERNLSSFSLAAFENFLIQK